MQAMIDIAGEYLCLDLEVGRYYCMLNDGNENVVLCFVGGF